MSNEELIHSLMVQNQLNIDELQIPDSKHVIKLRRKIINSNSDLINLHSDDFVKACKDICKKVGLLNSSKLAGASYVGGA